MELHDHAHNERLKQLISDAGISYAAARRILSAELCARVPEYSFHKWFRPHSSESYRPAPAWAPYVLAMGLRKRRLLPLGRSRM